VCNRVEKCFLDAHATTRVGFNITYEMDGFANRLALSQIS
jgi:hypothetical protein